MHLIQSLLSRWPKSGNTLSQSPLVRFRLNLQGGIMYSHFSNCIPILCPFSFCISEGLRTQPFFNLIWKTLRFVDELFWSSASLKSSFEYSSNLFARTAHRNVIILNRWWRYLVQAWNILFCFHTWNMSVRFPFSLKSLFFCFALQ